MFVRSLRASTVKIFTVIFLAVALLCTVVVLSESETVFASADGAVIEYGGIKGNAERVEFIRRFGLAVEEAPIGEEAFSMPESLDRVLLGYNELQRSQGLDISKYLKKKVTRYTYRVTNYEAGGEVVVNLLVHSQRIIAADLSIVSDSIVLPLTEIDTGRIK